MFSKQIMVWLWLFLIYHVLDYSTGIEMENENDEIVKCSFNFDVQLPLNRESIRSENGQSKYCDYLAFKIIDYKLAEYKQSSKTKQKKKKKALNSALLRFRETNSNFKIIQEFPIGEGKIEFNLVFGAIVKNNMNKTSESEEYSTVENEIITDNAVINQEMNNETTIITKPLITESNIKTISDNYSMNDDDWITPNTSSTMQITQKSSESIIESSVPTSSIVEYKRIPLVTEENIIESNARAVSHYTYEYIDENEYNSVLHSTSPTDNTHSEVLTATRQPITTTIVHKNTIGNHKSSSPTETITAANARSIDLLNPTKYDKLKSVSSGRSSSMHGITLAQTSISVTYSTKQTTFDETEIVRQHELSSVPEDAIHMANTGTTSHYTPIDDYGHNYRSSSLGTGSAETIEINELEQSLAENIPHTIIGDDEHIIENHEMSLSTISTDVKVMLNTPESVPIETDSVIYPSPSSKDNVNYSSPERVTNLIESGLNSSITDTTNSTESDSGILKRYFQNPVAPKVREVSDYPYYIYIHNKSGGCQNLMNIFVSVFVLIVMHLF